MTRRIDIEALCAEKGLRITEQRRVIARVLSEAEYHPDVDALHERATLSDAEFAALRAHYDEAQIFEILLLCGFYRTVSYISNGLKLPLEETAARFPKA